MKVLYAASEAVPFIKTGGLGDVAGSLPIELSKNGTEVKVMLPLYAGIGREWRDQMDFICEFYVPLAWRSQYCGLFHLKKDGVDYYFLDNEFYFNRSDLYGYFDDGERFAFYSRAMFEAMISLDWYPDVIHANDWQTTLVILYLKLNFSGDDRFNRIKTVFTIHNIQYQGRFPFEFLEDVAGISRRYADSGILAFDYGINLMKGAILYCEAFTTVSPTYAQEIQMHYYAHGLHGVVSEYSYKLTGILNGIDPVQYNPATDECLFAKYSPSNMKGKRENKIALQKMLGLNPEPDVPIIAMISRLTGHKGLDLVRGVLDEIMDEQLQFVVLGKGDWNYEQMFMQAQNRYDGRLSANITFSSTLANQIYAGADMLLIPSQSEPCGLTQMIAMRYGTVPIVRETGGLKDTVFPYDIANGTGNGFTIRDYNAHDMLYVIREAVAMCRNKKAWQKLISNAMKSDNSWEKSAGSYMALYEKAMSGI